MVISIPTIGSDREPAADHPGRTLCLGYETIRWTESGKVRRRRRALAVLRLLASAAEPLPAAGIARSLGLPRSSTYHLRSAMAEEGFVTHLPEDRRWGLGVAAFEIGSAYLRQGPLERLARPLLHRLVDRSGRSPSSVCCTAPRRSTCSRSSHGSTPPWSPTSASGCRPS